LAGLAQLAHEMLLSGTSDSPVIDRKKVKGVAKEGIS